MKSQRTKNTNKNDVYSRLYGSKNNISKTTVAGAKPSQSKSNKAPVSNARNGKSHSTNTKTPVTTSRTNRRQPVTMNSKPKKTPTTTSKNVRSQSRNGNDNSRKSTTQNKFSNKRPANEKPPASQGRKKIKVYDRLYGTTNQTSRINRKRLAGSDKTSPQVSPSTAASKHTSTSLRDPKAKPGEKKKVNFKPVKEKPPLTRQNTFTPPHALDNKAFVVLDLDEGKSDEKPSVKKKTVPKSPFSVRKRKERTDSSYSYESDFESDEESKEKIGAKPMPKQSGKTNDTRPPNQSNRHSGTHHEPKRSGTKPLKQNSIEQSVNPSGFPDKAAVDVTSTYGKTVNYWRNDNSSSDHTRHQSAQDNYGHQDHVNRGHTAISLGQLSQDEQFWEAYEEAMQQENNMKQTGKQQRQAAGHDR